MLTTKIRTDTSGRRRLLALAVALALAVTTAGCLVADPDDYRDRPPVPTTAAPNLEWGTS